jgi:hypothetical protein
MLYVSLALWTLLLATPTVAPATPIFSNFGAGFSYDTTTGNPVGNGLDGTGFNYAQGDTFEPTANATLGSIVIALSNVVISEVDPITVALMQDNGDQPGAALESFVIPAGTLGNLGNNNPPVVENSVLHLPLLVGTQYWITVSVPFSSSIAWNLNTTGDTADHALSIDGGATWFSPSGNTPGAFAVNPVPEPSTLGPLASGVLALAGLQLRRLCKRGRRRGMGRLGVRPPSM